MTQTIYLKIERNNEVASEDVTIDDVATVYCADSAVVNKVKTLKIMKIPAESRRRYSISAMKLIELIQTEYPSADIENIGESDCVVDYIDEAKRNHRAASVWNIVKVVMICVVTFFGSAYAIIAYNNDVGTTEIFSKIYELLMGEAKDGAKWMEVLYSVGLLLGITVFYNHFGSKSFSNDPTPIEVEMNTYEQDIDSALIERASRSNKEQE